MKKILVLFKTHLDVGFTDYSKVVVDNYIHSFIPKALDLARSLRGQEHRFIWTTGSWLIDRFLKEASPDMAEKMEDAIRHGEISWHALPFTTHTELMTRELFEYGLSLSKALDERFSIHTTGAKMTDVPGHTRAVIEPMVKAGVKFLHIGVNVASCPPKVPQLFRWQDDRNNELIVMYHSCYGAYADIPGTDTAVYFAHTNDNLGPQTKEGILQVYDQLHQQYPDAILQAGTLNDVADAVEKARPILPVVRQEIGDSWIRGTGCDPEKVRHFRELLRNCFLLNEEDRKAVYQEILPVPEHTWGMDIKTHLGTFAENGQAEHRYYIRSEFEKARNSEKFKKVEKSWDEQRDYVRNGEKVFREKAGFCPSLPAPSFPDFSSWDEVDRDAVLMTKDFSLHFNQNGAMDYLAQGDRILSDEKHPLGQFLYQTFSAEDYRNFKKAYNTLDCAWAKEDFGKVGMEKSQVPSSIIKPQVRKLYRKGNRFAVVLSFEGDACEKWGAPREAVLQVQLFKDSMDMELIWKKKPANRLPEALWLRFCPVEEHPLVSKLSQWIDPADVVDNGGRYLHATDFGVKYPHLTIESKDCALLSVGEPALLRFDNQPIPMDKGVSFNLFNNAWGTNFVMWYEDDASFRFHLSF